MSDKFIELEEKISNQANHIKIIERVIKEQKRQITIMRESLECKNRELDALHYVWCNGGCGGGVHRYDSMKGVELTEEIVKIAERNTQRLRTWFINYKFRNKTDEYKDKYFKSFKYRIRLILKRICDLL